MNKYLIMAVVMATPVLVWSDDWPQFLGIQRNGNSAETGLADSWPESGPPRVWDREIGTGYSAPSVIGDKLVLHHRIGDEEVILCLDVDTQEKIWEHKYPSKFRDPYGYNNGPRCTPILTPDRCYTFGAEGVLSCVDMKDGSSIWQVRTQDKWKVPEAFFGVGSTPLLDDGRLYVMVGGQPNSGMVAFDAASGEVLWESVGRENWDGQKMIGWPGNRDYEWKGYEKIASYSSPVLAQVHGKPVLFGFMRQGLVAMDPETGKVSLSYWFQARVQESVNAINPVVLNNQVLLSSCYYRQGSVLLDLNENIEVAGEVWRGQSLEIHFTTPILHGGHVYAFSGRNPPDASLRCVEYTTGKLKWERDESVRTSSDATRKFGRGSAILADEKIIALGETGILGLFRPNIEKVEEISRFKVRGIDYPAWTAPILSDGHLYLRSENTLVKLDVRKSGDSETDGQASDGD